MSLSETVSLYQLRGFSLRLTLTSQPPTGERKTNVILTSCKLIHVRLKLLMVHSPVRLEDSIFNSDHIPKEPFSVVILWAEEKSPVHSEIKDTTTSTTEL